MPELEIEVIARGACVQSGRVLLCKSIKGNYFYLPGGHIEYGESAADALAREFVEETGSPVRVGSLALVQEHFFRQGPHLHHELNFVFHVELRSDQVVSREKKIAFEWTPIGKLADLDFRPDAHRSWLQRMAAPGQPPEWISSQLE